MQMPLIVSHYTRNTGYETEVKHLRDSLNPLDLDYWIEGINSLGSWRANSNYCAKQVQTALKLYPDRDVLRVDCDARFRSRPELFLDPSFDGGVAAVIHDFPYRKNELLGGTMFFRNTISVRGIVACWADLACDSERKNERNGDLLQELLGSSLWLDDPKFYNLPPTYCQIFDSMKDCGTPVIEHFQASRRFKRKVNRAGMK